jgi:hypothetical protein
MWRKNDAHKDELEGVAQRLRDERPQASPLELDQIKRTAMSRAKAGSKGSRFGARRFAVAGMALGLMAAGTGGVLAAGGSGGGVGNAAVAQYSSNECGNENDNSNNSGNININCGSGSITNEGNTTITEGNTTITENSNNTTTNDTNNSNSNNTTNTNSSTNNVTNNYYSSTVTLSGGSGASGVQASKQTKASASKRSFSVHFFAAHGRKLKKLTVTLNGKVIKVLTGHNIPTTLDFVNVPCSNVKQSLKITGTLSNGKKVTETRHYNLCQ